MPVPFGPAPGPGEVRLEMPRNTHQLLVRMAAMLDGMLIEDCFWHAAADGWELLQHHERATLWVELPNVASRHHIAISCCGGAIVKYPLVVAHMLGISDSQAKIGFTGAIDESTVTAVRSAAAHWRCNETDAYCALVNLGVGVRLVELLGGSAYFCDNFTGEFEVMELSPLP